MTYLELLNLVSAVLLLNVNMKVSNLICHVYIFYNFTFDMDLFYLGHLFFI